MNFASSPGRLREVFREFGELKDVYVPLDFKSGHPRGFGFVEYVKAG